QISAPDYSDITTPEGLREILNRAIIYLHGYGTVNTSSPPLLSEEGGAVRFHPKGISTVLMAPGNARDDRVEDDAKAVRRAIELLNDWRGPDALPWVVFGHSMGGLMARLALVDMEADGIDHDVALYISYDSPHKGVHVPQGMQYLK